MLLSPRGLPAALQLPASLPFPVRLASVSRSRTSLVWRSSAFLVRLRSRSSCRSSAASRSAHLDFLVGRASSVLADVDGSGSSRAAIADGRAESEFALRSACTMLPLAVLIFLVTLAVEVVGWIGKDTLANVVFPLFATGPSAKQTRAYKAEILAAKAELAATSSQDEFAKWAKLRRKLDKSVAELEALSTSSTPLDDGSHRHSRCRRRDSLRLWDQVQGAPLGPHHRAPLRHLLMAQEGGCLLPPPGLVRPCDLLSRTPLRPHRSVPLPWPPR